MTLRIFENSLENVKPALHGEYEQQADGTWKLMLSDLDEHVAGLKSALRKCRDELKALRATGGMPDGVAALNAFGGMPKAQAKIDPAAVRAGILPRTGRRT